MDRRAFVAALGVGGLLAIPLGCGPKKSQKEEDMTEDEKAGAVKETTGMEDESSEAAGPGGG